MESLMQDVRYALRVLAKSPAWTLSAALVVMLGTASVTTIFSVVDTLLLRPRPALGDPARLVDVTLRREPGQRPVVVSYPLYRDLARRTRTLSGLAAYADAGADLAFELRGPNPAHEAHAGMIVSGNYFDVLRVRAAAGRFFARDEDSVPLARPVMVVSARLAESRLGGVAAAVGREVDVNGTRFTVVGVAPAEFGGTVALMHPEFFVPAMMTAVVRPGMADLPTNRKAAWATMVGRLADGASRENAAAELGTLLARVDAEYPAAADENERITVARQRPIPVAGQSVVGAFMGVLMTVAGLVLLIASVNVGNMLLARGIARRREIGVRLAIGATPRRLVAQLLTESVALFLFGGAGGVLLTAWGVRVAQRVHLDLDAPLRLEFPVDGRVMTFTLLVAFASGVAFGLAPALAAARRDVSTTLRGDAAGVADRRSRARGRLVIAQLAMAVLLLVSAGLFLRALERSSTVDPGYDYRRVTTAELSLANAGYDSVSTPSFLRELTARVAALPGVRDVAFSTMPPLGLSAMMTVAHVPGRPAPGRGERPELVSFEIVGPGYFRTLGLPLVAGRAIDATDVQGAARAAVVSASFVTHYLPGLSPQQAVGRTFASNGITTTIVGVAHDARLSSMTDDPTTPTAYFSNAQRPMPRHTLLVRTSPGVDPAGVAPAVQRVVAAMDPRLARPKVQSVASLAATGLLPQRVAALVTASLGALGLLLAGVGVYGVIAYGVGQRAREIGVRMAMGATAGVVVRMVVREGWRLAAVGLGVGLTLAALLARALTRFLFGVSPFDPLTLVCVPAVLLAVTLLASWLPARRAARVDVVRALRD